MFKGSIVALTTPFKNNRIDELTLKKLVRFHIENGTDGIVPCGTTGESATLSYREHERVIEIVVKETAGRIPVIAGAGSNSTTETIDMCRFAKKTGADAVLLVAPYYNKPTQHGLYQHFSAVTKAVSLPIILYNIPGRTGINMEPATIIRLAQSHANIVGLKDSTGNMDQASEIVAALGETFTLLSGDDALTLPLMAIGAQGIISVAANIIPHDMKELVDSWNRGDIKRSRRIHLRMFPLIKALFIQTSPVPVKTAMGLMVLCSPQLRLPMAAMLGGNKKKLIDAMRQYGINIKG
jgi:4-hydroxy-tetrahydrodipicolinate synthase